MRRSLLLLLACLLVSAAHAQETTFQVTIENVGLAHPVLKSGAFTTPVGAGEAGPIGPGGAYEVTFTAGPGTHLSFATMFAQSNDAFYAPAPEGIPLFVDGAPMTGDVTEYVMLWDAGTEVDEEPGVGPNQAPRQSAPDTGEHEGGVIVEIDGEDDGYSYPPTEEVIRVTLSNENDTEFTLRVENVSTGETLQTSEGSVAVPLSPGAWAVHSEQMTFFEPGMAASAGIEAIAEDGNAAPYADALAAMTGRTVPLSPGAWAVHSDATQLFMLGAMASEGIEAVAEDGNPAPLADMLTGLDGIASSGVFNTPEGAADHGPLLPGGRYSFMVDAMPGDLLSLATMYAQSNDAFFAFSPDGLPLFDGGQPVRRDVTSMVALYDAGTEVDEEPGVGLDQAPRQSGPDTGEDEGGVIVEIDGEDDGYSYPPPSAILRVTVAPVDLTPIVVRVENVSTDHVLHTSEGPVGVPLSPGAWAIHSDQAGLFEVGMAASAGIEAVAEDGNPATLAMELMEAGSTASSGVFNTPVGAEMPGPAMPGDAYEFTVFAMEGEYLSLATMFVQSNDAFYAPAPEGIPLFVDGAPMTGDVTEYVMLWDAGTEVDEEPGVGPNQAPRQSGPDTGQDEGGVIVEIDGEDDGYSYPATEEIIRVTLMRATQTDTEEPEEKPVRFGALESYPNPFRDRATLRYGLDAPGHVTLAIYDVLGRRVTTLVDGPQRAGEHRVVWDAQGRALATGVYLLRLALDGRPATTRTLTLVR